MGMRLSNLVNKNTSIWFSSVAWKGSVDSLTVILVKWKDGLYIFW